MYPTLDEKVDIAQNAIDLAHVLGIDVPRVAVLSAVETVSAKIPSTLDAAALTVMASRGQIRGAVVDGPLAFDNAVDPEAARIKGIKSDVAGRADILLVPNFEAGNMVAKELSKIAHGAGIVMGARCPIVLTSRSDDERPVSHPAPSPFSSPMPAGAPELCRTSSSSSMPAAAA